MGMESIYKLSVLVNMIDRITGPTATIRRAVGDTTTKFQEYSHNMARMATDGAVLIGTGQQVAVAVLAPVKATFSTQDALAELASLGIQDLNMLEGAAKNFSSTWAGTTKPEFLTAAYDIKSGVASLSDQGVADMTRIAAVTAKATKSTAAEMTSLFATGYGIYKDYYNALSDLEFGEVFSSGIAKSVQQFKTTGSGMAQAISALGGSATAAGAPLEEQLAILGMLQATMSGSEAGTKYTAFLQNAARAGQELGLNFTDANGQLKGMPEILRAIKGKFGEAMTAADKLELQKAFGTVEAVKLIDLLYGKTDDLQSNIITLYDTMGQGMKVTEEMANKINAPPGQSWQVFAQKVQASMETVGNAMLPTFIKMQESADKLITKFADFTTKHPKLISTIMYSVLAFGTFLTVLGGLKLLIGATEAAFVGFSKLSVFTTKALEALKYGTFLVQYGFYNLKTALVPLGKGFLTMAGSMKTALVGMLAWVKQGIMSALSALPRLITSVWSFTAALLANPITWIVIGIVALIGTLILLWKNWDTVSAFIQNVWAAACQGVMSGIDWLKNGIAGAVAWFTEKLTAFRELGGGIVGNIVDGIVSVALAPYNAVKWVLDKVRNLLPFSDAKEGPLSDLTLSGQRVFETMNAGMMSTADLPAQTMEDAFAGIDPSGTGKPGITDVSAQTAPKQTIIQKLILQCDLASIEDLKKLKKLLAEIEDECNSSGTPQPVPEGG